MNIVYENTRPVELNNRNKPIHSWMEDWTLDQRKEKFFEFCRVFDKREDDLLKEDYQIFSHRLHWHEHPYCDEMRNVDDLHTRIWYTMVFSFSNEHWLTFKTLKDQGIESLRERFVTERHARSDLFQIYYPKGTNVREWLLDGPKRCADYMTEVLASRTKRWTMMELAKVFCEYYKEHQGFRAPMYPCKNFARYMAMTWPKDYDPESVLFGGTGHFDGLHQIFGGKNLMNKVKYDIDNDGKFVPLNYNAELWLNQMDELIYDSRNPMVEQKFLNVEDKTCFFYKHIAINHGVKSPTKRIPYEWIFPSDFSLKN
jgi:hypothetical protein|tara:strand:- start:1554 stop:2492 length:939 start_codon:yes stop_codon:yes gene_type:complete